MVQTYVFLSAKRHWRYAHVTTEGTSVFSCLKVVGICKHITILILNWDASRLVASLGLFIPLYRCLMFLLLQFVANLLICPFRYSRFYSWNICWHQVLHCSDYTHSFPLDVATNAAWIVLFGLIILDILPRTMIYASFISNILNFL
jgi:hypothetical protein